MTDLVQFAIDAHGGMERYGAFSTLTAKLYQGGALWGLKGKPTILQDAHVKVDLKREHVSHWPFSPTTNRSSFTPERVEILDERDAVVEALDDPRPSFEGFELGTPWSNPQVAYFAGYTMWTYLTSPFIFREPGVRAEEMEPWSEDGETWRRLRVEFPDTIATHCRTQTYYLDDAGLIRRHDYEVDIQGRNAAARYLRDPVQAQGITLYSTMRIYPRLADNSSDPNLLIVSIDLSDYRLE